MATFNNSSGHVFNRSFDTASQNSSSESSSETGNSSPRNPATTNRWRVPYVNERREFDPRYDPRRPETVLLHHQPQREGPVEEPDIQLHQHAGLDDAEIPTNLTQRSRMIGIQAHPLQQQLQDQADLVFHESGTTPVHSNVMYRRLQQRNARAILYYNSQRRRGHLSALEQSTTRRGSQHTPRQQQPQQGITSFFQPEQDARLDRPFDEFSNSNKETDSLEELMQQQDSFTTASSKAGEENFDVTTLSAIEEHPTLEGGSLSYSYTQVTGPSILPSLKSAETEDDLLGRQPVESSFFSSLEDIPVQNDPDRNHPQQPVPTTSATTTKAQMEVITPEPFGTFQHQPFETFQQHPMQQQQRNLGRSPNCKVFSSEGTTPGSSTATSRSTVMTPVSTTSATSSISLGPTHSETARREAEKLVQGFKKPGRRATTDLRSNDKVNAISTVTSDPSTTAEDTQTINSEEQDLTLHDLCGESSSTDDIAWRNALLVLSAQPHLASVLDAAGWTPLHVACLGTTPPPLFMTRSLLYVFPEAAQKVDGGGRLPLHLVAASSGDIETMQLLIQAYPKSVYQTDCQGWTPLHLMLKNFGLAITLEHCRVLLGLTRLPDDAETTRASRIVLRRREHLSLRVDELGRILPQSTPLTRFVQDGVHEQAFRDYPNDVQSALRNLCQWKRKERRRKSRSEQEDEEGAELEMVQSSLLESETINPAAQFTPVNRQLPVHMIVRRGLSASGSKREVSNQCDRSEKEEVGGDEDNDREEPSSTQSALAPRFLELVRLFTAFYPEGLVARDFQGHTPLLTALTLLTSTTEVSIEIVELLLGKRTAGYKSLPSWARNMPLYSVTSDRYINPAMVPCKMRQQLPLHVVAEDMPGNFSLLSTVHDCYPGAIEVQDARGRTPLHILLRNCRRDPLNPRAVALLLSDTVAQARDDDSKLPFDLLADAAAQIPSDQPYLETLDGTYADDDVNIFSKFFQGSIMASSKANARIRFDPDVFLWRLRSLPPWLRRQACSATFVQDLLVEELASPMKCTLILLYAALLSTLIVVFRLQVQHHINLPDIPMPPWTSFVVLAAAFAILLFQLIFWSLCRSMTEFLHLCVFNVWRWVDLAAIILVTTATTMLSYSSFSNEVILATAAAATGMLWFSAIGFFSSWWYGAALFTAAVQKVSEPS
jgi:hypothetical protein